jgi:hypothetical protein
MKANFSGVTTAHTQTGTRSNWKRRDEARKREIALAEDDKRTASLIMDSMAGEIAELRKPKPNSKRMIGAGVSKHLAA